MQKLFLQNDFININYFSFSNQPLIILLGSSLICRKDFNSLFFSFFNLSKFNFSSNFKLNTVSRFTGRLNFCATIAQKFKHNILKLKKFNYFIGTDVNNNIMLNNFFVYQGPFFFNNMVNEFNLLFPSSTYLEDSNLYLMLKVLI